jgi:hypothetical protein
VLAFALLPGRAAAVSVTIPGTDCPAFPADNYWNTPIDRLPVHRRSATWVRAIGRTERLHPDFGPSFGEQSLPYGIPVTVVGSGHPVVPVTFDYADESDHARYPLGADTLIEGGREADGDRHTVVVDASSCTLYETWDTHPGPVWHAGSGAIWDLRSNRLRPRTWTSADAAGLPILPGLLTYDEVRAGAVRHAIRFTAPRTRDRFVWPARHQAGSESGAGFPPMGARFRLRDSFRLAGWSPQARVVLRGLQRFGLVLADNGSPWFFQGMADDRWPADLVDELKHIPASAFQAVATGRLRHSGNSAAVRSR